jgi:hypothetical protein
MRKSRQVTDGLRNYFGFLERRFRTAGDELKGFGITSSIATIQPQPAAFPAGEA